ncbi:hypothetical protein HK103_007428 [Boothiomyces macroporosus]|uniref:Uncharacterized protein n=1 Tax=Boothiomyces macroporosus TaxID=261099 RepID=A0AAD5UKV1_9FUNG|nr:hypothetical protein HK103_007428 [Boothiomyces macroporosus]
MIFLLLSNALGQLYGCEQTSDPVACFIKNSQYTVVGTVLSTDVGTPFGNPTNYGAKIAIRCMYASFTVPPSSGDGIVGNTVSVTGFGTPNGQCGTNINPGATANVGDTKIYFLYVATTQSGVAPKQMTYSLQNPCTGGIPFSVSNMYKIGDILASNPGNAINGSSFGSDPTCAIPPKSFNVSGVITNSSGVTTTISSGAIRTVPLAFLSVVLLVL